MQGFIEKKQETHNRMQVSRDKVAIVGFRLKGLESISGWTTLERSCSKPASETQKKLRIGVIWLFHFQSGLSFWENL